VPAGEESKSLEALGRVLDFLVEARLDRSSALVLLGGGVVGDLGGLAAALYLRGIDAVHCPTTLLAQVDSAVGGKTAVNLRAGKNLAGAFHQPRAVHADVETLATLADEELCSGLGEVLKSALVGDPELFLLLEEHAEGLLARAPELLAGVVERCVRIKVAVVERDEREAGERKRLNLGHTFAHAIEQASGWRVPHGMAVAAGVCLALRASGELGLLADAELPARTARLCARLGLPASLAELRGRYRAELAPAALCAALGRDKKGRAGEPALVLPRALGELELDVRPPDALLAALLA
jgi:3-dehydroquinate synthase